MKNFLFFLLLVSPLVMAQETKEKWDYPIKPGTEEWKALRSIDEQFDAYNIPEKLLSNISTEELIKVCLSYPEWGLINAYNDRGTGFAVLVSKFNGFQELFLRKDAAIELIEIYSRMNPGDIVNRTTPLEQGLFGFEFTKIELFLLNKAIISQLNKNELKKLKDLAITRNKQKKELPRMYSLWDMSPTVGICISLLRYMNPDAAKQNPAISIISHNLMTDSIKHLDEIVELLETTEL